jgi:hypothetical protein
MADLPHGPNWQPRHEQPLTCDRVWTSRLVRFTGARPADYGWRASYWSVAPLPADGPQWRCSRCMDGVYTAFSPGTSKSGWPRRETESACADARDYEHPGWCRLSAARPRTTCRRRPGRITTSCPSRPTPLCRCALQASPAGPLPQTAGRCLARRSPAARPGDRRSAACPPGRHGDQRRNRRNWRQGRRTYPPKPSASGR